MDTEGPPPYQWKHPKAQPPPPPKPKRPPGRPKAIYKKNKRTVCKGCGRWWEDLDYCHCKACHGTFETIEDFDAHRKRGKCVSS